MEQETVMSSSEYRKFAHNIIEQQRKGLMALKDNPEALYSEKCFNVIVRNVFVSYLDTLDALIDQAVDEELLAIEQVKLLVASKMFTLIITTTTEAHTGDGFDRWLINYAKLIEDEIASLNLQRSVGVENGH